MTDRPILFSAPMVQALLREIEQPGSGKTQTRRLLKPQPKGNVALAGIYAPGLTAVFEDLSFEVNEDQKVKIPFVPGDRLWVKETWRTWGVLDHHKPSMMSTCEVVQYDADGGFNLPVHPKYQSGKTRVSIHMPRWASRITLEVTDVRVERLQGISPDDAVAEGINPISLDSDPIGYENYRNEFGPFECPVDSFQSLWDSLNADRAPWASNPWIVAVTFTPHLTNIDHMENDR